MAEPRHEVRIAGDEVQVRVGRRTLGKIGVADFVRSVARAAGQAPDLILPAGVRLLRQRGDAIGIVVEIPPQARTVRWLADDSEAPFGKEARYRDCFLAFPYVELLLVLRRGRLTGQQQLYYRTAPLAKSSDPLLLPNLYNVAEGYGQRCWVCLQHLKLPAGSDTARTVAAAVEHVFGAAFNKSSEVHEGNSYWGSMKALDTRVASIEAWEEATRKNRYFALEVPWKPADTSVSAELDSMLDEVSGSFPSEPNANHLAGLVMRGSARRSIG